MSTNDGIQLPLEMDTKSLNGALGSMDAVLTVLNSINKTVGDISGKIGGVGNKMNKEFKEAEKGASGLIDKLGKIGLAIDGVKGIVGSVVGTLAPIFEEGMARENAENIFGKMLGTPEQGKAYAKELRESSLAALYGGGTVNNAAQQMLAFGIGGKDTKDVLNAIGNIAMGDANKLNSLSLAFAQMSSLGKLQTQDWKQMIGQGFNPLNEIAKKTGETMEQLQERMSKGAISAEEVKDAFIAASSEGGSFTGVMDDRMKGVGGGLKAIESSLGDLYASLYELITPIALHVLPIISAGIREVNDLINGQAPILEAIVTAVTAATAVYTAFLAVTKAQAIWTAIVTKAQYAWNLAMTLNPIGLIIAGVTALIALFLKLSGCWDGIVKAFKDNGIIGAIKAIGQSILHLLLTPLRGIFQAIAKVTGADWAKKAAEGLDFSFGDIKSDDKSTGITPGQEGESTMGGKTNTTSANGTASSIDKGAKAVATGGTRNTSITISMGSLVHQITYQGGVEKNSKQTTQDLQEALLRVLSAASNTAE